jgi:lipopolysaccharide export system protein LptA
MSKKLIFASILFMFHTSVYAQNLVNLLRSDRVNTIQTDQGLVRKLIGNVSLSTRDIQIDADSAWHFVDLAEVSAFGNLMITTKDEKIYADSLRYDIEQEISSLNGRVIITNATMAIYSESALYSFLTEIALFNDPIWLQDTSGVMRAESGVYFNANDSVAFFGNVQLADSTQYIEADSLFSARKAGTYALHGNVLIQSTSDRTDIAGDFVYSDSTGKRIIDGNARLMRYNEDASDTTWLAARFIEVNRVDSLNTIDAYGDVISVQRENSARSDTLHFKESTGVFNLRHNPSVWYKNIQLTGDLIDVFTENDSLKSLSAIHNSFVVQQDTITLRLHQMKGDSITVQFVDGNITLINNFGGSEILLHYVDDQDVPDGALTFTSRQGLVLYFEDGEISDVTAMSNIIGETLPESAGLPEIRLDGFRWDPELRPQQWDLMLKPRLPEVPFNPPFQRTNYPN